MIHVALHIEIRHFLIKCTSLSRSFLAGYNVCEQSCGPLQQAKLKKRNERDFKYYIVAQDT